MKIKTCDGQYVQLDGVLYAPKARHTLISSTKLAKDGYTVTHKGGSAVVTDSQWVTWSAWLSQTFVNADVEVFPTAEEAEAWLESAA